MPTRSKLMTMELLSGVFGWAWIIAFGFAVYYLFSNDPWSSFFWALGISAVAKWLARGFNDHKVRLFYVDDLMQKGMSQAEANEQWYQEYMQK